jgi:F-type H+-transporting ATPase subunit beta
MANIGKVKQVIGPVIDVSFENGESLPNILDSLVITKDNGQKVILECQKHIGEDTIRTISMDASDGLRRGMEVVSTGAPIIMPIGEKIRGRLFQRDWRYY